MPSLRISLSIKSFVSGIRAFFNAYKKRVIAAGGVIQNEPCAINKLKTIPLSSASWVLVPSGIEEDVVFAQKPTSGLGDLNFTRASDATYTDAGGVVRRSPYNLNQFSEQFDNAYWSKFQATVSANTTTAPNGTLTADKLIEDPTTQFHSVFINTAFSVLIGQPYTRTVYAKADGRNWISLLIIDSTQYRAFFDLQNGVVGTVSAGLTASIQDAGNGWYRCQITRTAATASFSSMAIELASANGTGNYLGNGTSGAFIWGAQLVEGTSALDYFPTTNRQDVPRIDFRNADGTLSSCGRLLLEPQRTNSIRNSSMVAAVAGSPGTLPTNWDNASMAGLTRTVVGSGSENGLQYIDLRYNGTANATTVTIWFETTTQIAAVTGQTWTNSAYVKLISGTANGFQLTSREQDAAGATLRTGSQSITPTSTLQRFTYTRTNDGTGTAFVRPSIWVTFTVGATYDFTIRIAAPQMELGAYATTWVPTTTAAVTRIADAASKTGVSSIIGQSAGTIFWDVNDLTGTTTGTGNPDFAIRNTAFTNWIGITTNSFALPFRVVVRPTSGSIINYEANITRAKAAVAWSSAGAVLYVNGVQVGTSAVNPNFSFDRIDMLGGIISYKTNQAALFPTRLTNAQLAQLTTL
jgi:hypothetical protein